MWRVNHIIKVVNAIRIVPPNTNSITQLSFKHHHGFEARFFSTKKILPTSTKCDKKVEGKKSKIKLKSVKLVNVPPYELPPNQSLPEGSDNAFVYPYLLPENRSCSTNSKTSIPSPPPSGPPENPTENFWDKNRKYIIGVILATVALAVAYNMGTFTKQDKSKKPAKTKRKKKGKLVFKDPRNSNDIPKKIPYLLIGGGTASFAAFRSIKSADPTAKVLVVANEPYFPYMRPPLSKEMWLNEDTDSVKKLMFKQWNGSERNLFYEPDDFYMKCTELESSSNGGVAVARGWTVTRIDPVKKIAHLEDGSTIEYNKCLIATGASPKSPPVFETALNCHPELLDKIKLYRNIYDFKEIYENLHQNQVVVIVGGGFLGSELACAIARRTHKNKQIHQIYREKGNLSKILPEYLSLWTTNKVKEEGVQVLSKTEITAVKPSGNQVMLILGNGNQMLVDHVIIAVGAEPNTEIAQLSGLEIDPDLGGFLVNAELQARSDLYIAGDCACFYDVKLGRRRIEHHDNAVVTGRLAGENMTGSAKPYLQQSMFWSDLGPDVGFEAVGIIDSSLPTVGVFAKTNNSAENVSNNNPPSEAQASPTTTDEKKSLDPEPKPKNEGEDFSKGVIFYLRNDIVVGILLWNVFNRMSIARQVLKDERKYDDLNEVAKLFNIHED